MPPRSTKKAAAKRPSPKSKAAAAKSSPSVPLPAVEEKPDPEVETSSAAVEKSVETVTIPEPAAVKAEVVKEEQAPPPSETPKPEVVEEEQAHPPSESTEVAEQQHEEEQVPPPSESTETAVKNEAAVEKDCEENKMDVDEGFEKVEKEAVEGEVDNATGGGRVAAGIVKGADELNGEDDDNSDEEFENDPSIYMQNTVTAMKKPKEFEIFVGGLHKEAVEDDLKQVFGVFGEIQSIRIARQPSTQKSKGFGFVRFATNEDTKKALEELKDGAEIKGKLARVLASQDKDTLYVRNICNTWTKDLVIETLKGFGVENIEEILLPEDPKNEGKIRGFGFLQFISHSDAMAAFHRLRQPDAVLGCDRSAKVAFATSIHPSEEALLQVKNVYIEGIAESWDEEKIKELCKQYGEIRKVQLSRNLSKAKRKDFGFVEFTSRESAVACVEGVNNAQLGEGETQIKANIAKLPNKRRPAKHAARGGFKVTKDGGVTENAGQSKKKNTSKSKGGDNKGKAESNARNTTGNLPSNSQSKGSEDKSSKKTPGPVKGKRRAARGSDAVTNERPLKQARRNQNFGKVHGRPSRGFESQRNTYSGTPEMKYVSYPTAYAPNYVPSASSYHAYASYVGTSGSRYRGSDLEPHAGYLSSTKPVQNPYGSEWRRAGAYNNQLGSSSGYAGAVPVAHSSYPVHQSYPGYEAGYTHPGSAAYGRSYY